MILYWEENYPDEFSVLIFFPTQTKDVIKQCILFLVSYFRHDGYSQQYPGIPYGMHPSGMYPQQQVRSFICMYSALCLAKHLNPVPSESRHHVRQQLSTVGSQCANDARHNSLTNHDAVHSCWISESKSTCADLWFSPIQLFVSGVDTLVLQLLFS